MTNNIKYLPYLNMQLAVVVDGVSPLSDHFPEEVGGLIRFHINGLVRDCSNSIANALELL